MGGANRLLGLVLGLVTGAFDCWLLALLLWFAASITTGQIDWLTTGVFCSAASGSKAFWCVQPRFCSIIKQILNKPRQN